MEEKAQHEIKINLQPTHNKWLIVDIDGVLAVEQYNIPISKRPVVSGAPDSVRFLKQKGYKILLFTSRPESQKEETIEWLTNSGIPFDDIIFNKPRGIIYIDDRGYSFQGWEQFFHDVAL